MLYSQFELFVYYSNYSNSTIRYSVFDHFQEPNMFGIRYSNIYQKLNIFGIRSVLTIRDNTDLCRLELLEISRETLHFMMSRVLQIFCSDTTALWESLGVDLDKTPEGYFWTCCVVKRCFYGKFILF